MIPQFPCYIFDVDGTLVDSAGDIIAAVRQVFAHHGREAPAETLLRSQIGRHLISTFRDAFRAAGQKELDELIEEYRCAYRARRHCSTKVFAGIPETLAALGGKKATATTKGTTSTRQVLEWFRLARYFDHVQGTDGFPAKPEPEVILRALDGLSAKPGECLMIGDTMADIEAGRRAGVATCAVRYGYGSAGIPEREPDYWVHDLRELVG